MATFSACLIIAIAVGLLAQRWKRRSGFRWATYTLIPVLYVAVVVQDAMEKRDAITYAAAPSSAVILASLPLVAIPTAIVVLILAMLPRRPAPRP